MWGGSAAGRNSDAVDDDGHVGAGPLRRDDQIISAALLLVGAGQDLVAVALLLLGAGVLGGFTTFSAFSLDIFAMLQRDELGLAAAYVTASVAGSVMMLVVGFWMVRATA